MKKINRFYIILILVSIVTVSTFYFIFNSFQSDDILERLFIESADNTIKDTFFQLKKHFDNNNTFLRIMDSGYLNITKIFDKRITNNPNIRELPIDDLFEKYPIKDVRIYDINKQLLFRRSLFGKNIEGYEDKISLILDYMIKNNEESFVVKFDIGREFGKNRDEIIFHKAENKIVAFTIKEKNTIEVVDTNFDLTDFELPEAVEYILLKSNMNDKTYFVSNSISEDLVINPLKKEIIYSGKQPQGFLIESNMVKINHQYFYEKTSLFYFPSFKKGSIQIGINTDRLFYLKSINRTTIIISSVIYALLLIGVIFFLLRQDNLAMITKAQQDKYNSLVVMTKQIAHEIRNPLNTLSMITKGIEYEMDEGKVSRDSVNFLYDRIFAIDKIIKDFNLITDKMCLEKRKLQIKSFFDKIIEKCKREYPQISFLYDINDCDIFIDSDRMEQAIYNLIKNSIEAMEKQDTKLITIKAVVNNKKLDIMINDTGTGIPNEVINQLFVPFTTTKADGSGLGLTVVKKIIEAHQGTISIRNAKEYGVDVKISIPNINS